MDWIASRLACSTDNAWIALKTLLRSEIEHHKALAPNSLPPEFADADKVVSISKSKTSIQQYPLWVSIEKREMEFVIRTPGPDGTQPIETRLIPRLNKASECRLFIGNEELEFWQASKLILEPILF